MIDIGTKRDKTKMLRLAAKIEAVAAVVVEDVATDLRDDIHATIDNNLAEGPALSPTTIARKGHSIKLLETGDMKRAVQVHGKGLDTQVGIAQNSSEYLKGKAHEYGDPANNLPKRSFIKSTWRRRREALLRKAKAEILAAL